MRDRAAAGADVIKVFASTSIRFGGVTNLSAAQLEAACGEARAQGLRSVVHLHRSDALRLTADAGCTQVEHGWLLEPGDVDVFVESGMYLGNQIDLLFRNYEERGDRYAGVGGYTLEGFANLQASRPGALAFFRAAAATPGVRIVYSTDANAGSHGANTDELVAYVEQGGQDPMEAVVSATSLAAESLGMEDRLGAIATGLEADIIALDGDPLTDPAALGRVVFRDARGAGLQERPAAGSPSVKICLQPASGVFSPQRLQTPYPRIESRTLRTDPVETDFLGQYRTVKTFVVPRNYTCDAPARSRFVIVVDVLWSRELFTHGPQRRHTVSREIDLRRKDLDIGKQQAFEFVHLDVRENSILIPAGTDPLTRLLAKVCLKGFDTPVALPLESIEINKRRRRIMGVVQQRHIGREPPDRNAAAACPCADTDQDRLRRDTERSQMLVEDHLHELLFRLSLHRHRETNHGRPPIRFFCHISPGMKPSSSHRLYPSGSGRRNIVRPSRNSKTTMSSRSNASTSSGDCVATMICRSFASDLIMLPTRAMAAGCKPSSGSSSRSTSGNIPDGRFNNVTRAKKRSDPLNGSI